MAAASELSRLGCLVTVLEARDRVGGRVWSHALDNGVVIERGGEFVSGRHDTNRRGSRAALRTPGL
ncbi:MAG: NAD(P)-binding protein [Streptosporangiales bacterium]|nr:NAD(P)-binding protein [Streptosporangiales bacterium]